MPYQLKSYRKFAATAVSAAMTVSAVTPALAAGSGAAAFTDVSERYNAAVSYLFNNHLTLGLTPTRFGTQEAIKRVDAAVMIAKVLNLKTVNVPDSGFNDVPARAKVYIDALKAAGLINGKTATSFGSEQKITRGEMALIIAKAYKLNGNTANVKFTDVAPRYLAAVAALIDNKVTQGATKTTFGTSAAIKRGDFAIFIYRLAVPEITPPEITAPVIESITASTVVINGKSYKLADNVKTILSPENAAVLKNAPIEFTETGDTVTGITSLEIKEGGKSFADQLVFDGENATIDGNLKVNADYVRVQNVTVKGNLEISGEVQNSFYGENVTVQGKTVVAEPVNLTSAASNSLSFKAAEADNASITFESSSLGDIEVKNEKASLTAKGNTKIKELHVFANASFTGETNASVEKLVIEEGVKTFELNAVVKEAVVKGKETFALSGKGTIQTLVIENKEAKITIGKESKITNVSLPTGTKVENVIGNYEDIKSNIGKVDGKPASPEPSPGGGGGGGVGSANPTPTTPSVAADTTDASIRKDIELTFTDDPAWRNSITAIKVNGVPIPNEKYDKTAIGIIKLAGSLFTEEQQYVITIEAAGYSSRTVNQQINFPTDITASGTYGPPEGTKTIIGNLTVSSPNVVLRNLTITGDLLISEGVGEGNVSLEGVTVQGKTEVRGGGANSIHFKNSLLVGTVTVNKANGAIRIVAEGRTLVKNVELKSYAKIQESHLTGGAQGFTAVELTDDIKNVPGSSNLQVNLEGDFDTIDTSAEGVKILLPANTVVKNFVISAPAAIEANANSVIRSAVIQAQNIVLPQKPQKLVVEIPGGGGVTIGVGAERETITENYTAPIYLLYRIESVQAVYDQAEEGTDIGKYPVGSKALLQAAIQLAQTVYNDRNATSEEINTAEKSLVAAFEQFEDSKILTRASAPTVMADASDAKIGQKIELSFTDNPEWRANITSVEINGTVITPSKYKIIAGKITLDASLFTEAKEYNVVLKATGYLNTTVVQVIELPTPKAAPLVATDISDAKVGQEIELSFTDNPEWRANIASVEINGTVITPSKYGITAEKITFDANLFTEAKEYTIVIKANGYSNATVKQTIEPGESQSETSGSIVVSEEDIQNLRAIFDVADIQYLRELLNVSNVEYLRTLLNVSDVQHLQTLLTESNIQHLQALLADQSNVQELQHLLEAGIDLESVQHLLASPISLELLTKSTPARFESLQNLLNDSAKLTLVQSILATSNNEEVEILLALYNIDLPPGTEITAQSLQQFFADPPEILTKIDTADFQNMQTFLSNPTNVQLLQALLGSSTNVAILQELLTELDAEDIQDLFTESRVNSLQTLLNASNIEALQGLLNTSNLESILTQVEDVLSRYSSEQLVERAQALMNISGLQNILEETLMLVDGGQDYSLSIRPHEEDGYAGLELSGESVATSNEIRFTWNKIQQFRDGKGVLELVDYGARANDPSDDHVLTYYFETNTADGITTIDLIDGGNEETPDIDGDILTPLPKINSGGITLTNFTLDEVNAERVSRKEVWGGLKVTIENEAVDELAANFSKIGVRGSSDERTYNKQQLTLHENETVAVKGSDGTTEFSWFMPIDSEDQDWYTVTFYDSENSPIAYYQVHNPITFYQTVTESTAADSTN